MIMTLALSKWTKLLILTNGLAKLICQFKIMSLKVRLLLNRTRSIRSNLQVFLPRLVRQVRQVTQISEICSTSDLT